MKCKCRSNFRQSRAIFQAMRAGQSRSERHPLRHGQGRRAAATVRREHHVDFGVIESDGDGFLAHYREKPVLDYIVSMGVYALQRRCVDLIAPDEALGMPDLLLRVRDSGQRVYCAREPGYWLDIGRVDDYEEAQRQIAEDPGRFVPSHG